MSFAKFFLAFGRREIKEGVQSAAAALARIDPETASAAQLDMLRERRDEYAGKLVAAKRALTADREETAAWQSKIEQSKEALRVLKGQLGESDSKDQELTRQGRQIVAQMDTYQAELEREQGEDVQAEELVASLQQVFDTLDGKLKRAGSELEAAKRRMQSAEAKKAHAAEMADLRKATEFGGMDGAFNAMSAAAEKAEREAQTLALTSARDTESEDLAAAILTKRDEADKAGSDPFAGV